MLYVHIADGFPVPSTNFFYPIFKSISIRVDDPPKIAGRHTSEAGKARLSDLQGRWKSNPQSLSESEKSSLEQGERAMNLTDDKIQAEAEKVGWEYAKQARKQFAKDRMYAAITGIDKPADASNALRVGQMFKDNEGHYRQATLEDVQNAGKIGGDAWASQYMKDHASRTSPERPIEGPEYGH